MNETLALVLLVGVGLAIYYGPLKVWRDAKAAGMLDTQRVVAHPVSQSPAEDRGKETEPANV